MNRADGVYLILSPDILIDEITITWIRRSYIEASEILEILPLLQALSRYMALGQILVSRIRNASTNPFHSLQQHQKASELNLRPCSNERSWIEISTIVVPFSTDHCFLVSVSDDILRPTVLHMYARVQTDTEIHTQTQTHIYPYVYVQTDNNIVTKDFASSMSDWGRSIIWYHPSDSLVLYFIQHQRTNGKVHFDLIRTQNVMSQKEFFRCTLDEIFKSLHRYYVISYLTLLLSWKKYLNLR